MFPLPSPPSVTLFSHLSLRLRLTMFIRPQRAEQLSPPHRLSASSSLFSPAGCISVCNCLSLFLWFPQHDSQWSPSPCTVCVCSGGSVSCNTRPCPSLTCPGDESLFTPAGECCPKCGRNGGEGPLAHTGFKFLLNYHTCFACLYVY